MPPAIRVVFQDPAFRYGIKFGIAGVLAVFLALLLRLHNPTWALFTIFVLMIAQYVGAIAEKSLFRIIGTIIGGIIGYFLTAGLQQSPVIFLILVALVVGACTTLFGQSRYPYAFLLCGLTTVVVVSNGLGDPDFSWQFALWRIEEVILGVLVALLVQSLLWPRFAREEFSKNARSAFADLQECLRDSSRAVFDGNCAKASQRANEFPARISALRSLLDFGARESRYFRDRLPTYYEITICLARVAADLATMAKPLPAGSYYHTHLRSACEGLHHALEEALGDLASSDSDAASRATHRESITEATQSLDARLLAIHDDPALPDLPMDTVTSLGLHLLALREIRQSIEHAHTLIDSLPTGWSGGNLREPLLSPLPTPYWIRAGIKSALAVVASLVLFNWLHPPGGSLFVLGAWVFTALNAFSPGGRGDRRAFHYVVLSTSLLVVVCLILLAIRPLLSSYGVMNTFIFSGLFAWGYLTFQIRGITIPMQISMLLMVSIVGLNGQEPISFQAVADTFFGLSFALVLAATIQRLLWPTLPQWELRDRYVELLRLLCRGMDGTPIPVWQRSRLALIPGEAEIRIGHLQPPFCPPGERERLCNYLTTLRQIGAHLLVSSGHLNSLLSKNKDPDGQARIGLLEAEIETHLRAHEIGMQTANPPKVDASRLASLLTSWVEWMATTRRRMLKDNCHALDIIQFIGLSGRHAECARGLLKAKDEADQLHLPDIMGDYVL